MTEQTENERSPPSRAPTGRRCRCVNARRAGIPTATAGTGGLLEAVRTVTGLDLPLTPNTMTMGESLSAIWLAPNEWLLVTPPDDAVSLQARLRAAFGNLFATATDVSSGYATLEIAGSQARALLARGCSVDRSARSASATAPRHCWPRPT